MWGWVHVSNGQARLLRGVGRRGRSFRVSRNQSRHVARLPAVRREERAVKGSGAGNGAEMQARERSQATQRPPAMA